MQKLTLFVLVILLAACTGSPTSKQNSQKNGQPGVVPGGTVQPQRQILTSDDLIRYNEDGSITMGQITLPNGQKINIRWMPMTMPQYKGAETETSNNEYDWVIAAETEKINKNPQDKEAYIRRAGFLFHRGRNPEDLENAREDCTTVLSRIDNNEPAAYYIRGLASAILKDYDQALSDLWTILNIREYMNIGIYYILGDIYAEMNRIDQAIEMFENVARIDSFFGKANEVLDKLRNR